MAAGFNENGFALGFRADDFAAGGFDAAAADEVELGDGESLEGAVVGTGEADVEVDVCRE